MTVPLWEAFDVARATFLGHRDAELTLHSVRLQNELSSLVGGIGPEGFRRGSVEEARVVRIRQGLREIEDERSSLLETVRLLAQDQRAREDD